MVLKPDIIEQRLKELNRILQELVKYEGLEPEALRNDLSQRWIIERGLIVLFIRRNSPPNPPVVAQR